ncbi:MAG: glycosyltransferase [Rhodospirillaceae bacterium]|nr:glycosyltransferase [Rhodospirillaceae bacterium]
MRVLQVMAGAEYGGAEAFFTRLVLALRRAGLHQRVVIRKNEARASTLREGGIEPVELRFGGPLDIWTRMGLKREIDSFYPHVVLTWMNRATSMCPRGDFVHVARLGGYYDLKYYSKCDHLVGNTEDIADYLTGKGWPAERAHYLPNFVSAETAAPLDRKDFYTPNDATLLLAMGRLHENKAFDVLLDALSRIPNAYLWLAGEGPKRAELEAQAEKIGVKPRVRFLGWRDDIAALLASCDVFVCPSRHEPLGNVVVEAWAQSKPVVAADSLGPGVLIKQDENGVLVPIDDSKSLSYAISQVLVDENLRSGIARHGRTTYEERFTEEAVVAQYLNFFESIVDKE